MAKKIVVSRREAEEELARHDMESLDDESIYQLLMEGCIGYENMDQSVLEECYAVVKGVDPSAVTIKD